MDNAIVCLFISMNDIGMINVNTIGSDCLRFLIQIVYPYPSVLEELCRLSKV